MGFTPDKESAGEGYHHLQLQVKRKDTTVQTRDGYFIDYVRPDNRNSSCER